MTDALHGTPVNLDVRWLLGNRDVFKRSYREARDLPLSRQSHWPNTLASRLSERALR
jgi:hypothetical protein